jgi:tetratricopeptide repeat protein
MRLFNWGSSKDKSERKPSAGPARPGEIVCPKCGARILDEPGPIECFSCGTVIRESRSRDFVAAYELGNDTEVSAAPSGSDIAGSVPVIKTRLDAGRRLFSDKRYSAALEEVIAVLDIDPKNVEALDLAGTILYLCADAHSQERIRPSVSEDPLLDPLFSQCSRCHSYWPGNPMLKHLGGQQAVINPIGGRCPRCQKVWCRKCAHGEMSLQCPECRVAVHILKEPSGRKRGLLKPPKHPDLVLRQVCIFKAPPKPRNLNSYATMVLDALCPEAFRVDAGIHVRTGEEGNKLEAATAYAVARWMANGFKVDSELTFRETFTDSDGGKGIILTFYERPAPTNQVGGTRTATAAAQKPNPRSPAASQVAHRAGDVNLTPVPLVETVESRAQRLREEAKRTVFPAKGSGSTVVISSQVGAAYGVQAIDDRALALIQSGIEAKQRGDFNKAVSLYKEALALEPGSVDAHNGLAGAYISLGKIEQAIQHHRIAIESAPAHIADKAQVVYVNMVNAILKKGLRPAAVDEFRAAAQGLPQSSGYHCALGLVYWKTGDPQKARAEFQEVLKIDQSGTCGQAARDWTGKIDRGETP